MAETAASRKELCKGTVPEGAVSEADASRKVREMFTQIAPRYDLLNHILSLQMDRMWRTRTARILRPILERSDARILDLCCGTGDLALALQRNSRGRVWGADFAHTMLVRAKEKSAPYPPEPGRVNPKGAAPGKESAPGSLQGGAAGKQSWVIPFVESDALRLPFANESFDLVTAAFGFRNLANYEAGLAEIQRVLIPGGTMAILEFSEPKSGWFGDLYRWYFRAVLPKIGGMISGDRAAYSYLPKSVARFFRPEEFSDLIQRSGFTGIQARVWTGGTVALHTGRKK
jgi:demethylmenaquinone methyltransferase/2-methoxy-6-polyprenyl-1,4-benzoquinol methylase